MIFYDVEHLYTTGTKKGDAKKLNRVFSHPLFYEFSILDISEKSMNRSSYMCTLTTESNVI